MKKNNYMKDLFILWFTLSPIIGLYAISGLDEKYFGGGAVILSAALALSAAMVSMYYQRKTAREKNTLDFLNNLSDDTNYQSHFLNVRAILADEDKDARLVELASPDKVNDKDTESIREVLNTWEQASNAVLHNLYDELYLYSSHKSQVITLSLVLRPYIRERQKTNVSLYSNFTWLALKWTTRRDSFESAQTKKDLKRVFRQLDKIKSGKLRPNQK